MDKLIKTIGEWAALNYDCGVEVISEEDGKYTVSFIDEGEESNNFTLEQAPQHEGRKMVRIVCGEIDAIVQAIPAVVGSIVYAA